MTVLLSLLRDNTSLKVESTGLVQVRLYNSYRDEERTFVLNPEATTQLMAGIALIAKGQPSIFEFVTSCKVRGQFDLSDGDDQEVSRLMILVGDELTGIIYLMYPTDTDLQKLNQVLSTCFVPAT